MLHIYNKIPQQLYSHSTCRLENSWFRFVPSFPFPWIYMRHREKDAGCNMEGRETYTYIVDLRIHEGWRYNFMMKKKRNWADYFYQAHGWMIMHRTTWNQTDKESSWVGTQNMYRSQGRLRKKWRDETGTCVGAGWRTLTNIRWTPKVTEWQPRSCIEVMAEWQVGGYT